MFVATTRDVTVDFAEVDDELGATLRVLCDKEAISSVEVKNEVGNTHVCELVVGLEEARVVEELEDVEEEVEELELDEKVLVALETTELDVGVDWLDVDVCEVVASDVVDVVVGDPKILVASVDAEVAASVVFPPFPPEAEEAS